MRSQSPIVVRMAAAGVVLGWALATAQAKTTRWDGAGQNWNEAFWNNGSPSNGDDVIINGNVILSNSTATLASYTLNVNCTNIFLGTNTILIATNVTISGTITHSNNTATTTNSFGQWIMNNRVYIQAASNVTVAGAGSINVDARGYQGDPAGGTGRGPGGGYSTYLMGSGGGHGGAGGNASTTYSMENDSLLAPDQPGSSGGGGTGGYVASGGGGAVRIAAGGQVAVDGTIRAAGGQVWGTGGGAGGSVYIECATFTGNGGYINVNGGGISQVDRGCGGGGGRISIVCSDLATQSNLTPTVRFSADGGTLAGTYGGERVDGRLGTLHLPDSKIFLIGETLTGGGVLDIPGFTNWSPNSLTITNGGIQFPPGFQLTVAGNLLLDQAGGLVLTNSVLKVGGKLTVTNAAGFYILAGESNSAAPGYGALVAVTGNVSVASNSDINPICHPTNGASVLFQAGSFTVGSNGTVHANGRGFGSGYGPGGGSGDYMGGSYGGVGGYGGKATYGLPNAPVQPGSGGSTTSDVSRGGGAVRIQAADRVTVHGTITANGVPGGVWGAGGGSGGSVYIECDTFDGAGVISANGADGPTYCGGGGGGGRVAILYANPAAQAALNPTVRITAAGGSDGADRVGVGEGGTLYLPDTCFLPKETLGGHNYMFLSPGFTNWAPNNLTLSNSLIRFVDGFRLAVTNNLVLYGDMDTYRSGWKGLDLRDHFILTCGGDLLITNGGALYLRSGMTNSEWPTHGGLVTVGGALTVATNSWMYLFSHSTNGGSVMFTVKDFTLAVGGKIDAIAKGYAAMNGPGKATGIYGGAGYGGAGAGVGSGQTYGSSNAPVDPGSGCGQGGGVQGGGTFRIRASRTIRVDGTISANGVLGAAWGAGGGSGGSIYMSAGRFGGFGTLSAAGGDGVSYMSYSGGGGGGRIAVWRIRDIGWSGPANVNGGVALGAGYTNIGQTGTIVWVWIPEQGSVLVVR